MTSIDSNILKAYSALLDSNLISGPTDFIKKIGYHKVSWAKVQSGARSFPEEKIDTLCSVFKLNKDYILNERGFVFMDQETIKKTEQVYKLKIKNKTVSFTDKYGLKREIIFEVFP